MIGQRHSEKSMSLTFLKVRTLSAICSLEHQPYLDILPKADKLYTPLYFTDDELSIFSGTNVHGAALTQKSIWEKEWKAICRCISCLSPESSEVFTW